MPAKPEAVDHPQHYGGDRVYEVIKFIEAHDLGFHLGNAVKYMVRAGTKDSETELEDLEKAAWYLNRYTELVRLGESPGAREAMERVLSGEEDHLA